MREEKRTPEKRGKREQECSLVSHYKMAAGLASSSVAATRPPLPPSSLSSFFSWRDHGEKGRNGTELSSEAETRPGIPEEEVGGEEDGVGGSVVMKKVARRGLEVEENGSEVDEKRENRGIGGREKSKALRGKVKRSLSLSMSFGYREQLPQP